MNVFQNAAATILNLLPRNHPTAMSAEKPAEKSPIEKSFTAPTFTVPGLLTAEVRNYTGAKWEWLKNIYFQKLLATNNLLCARDMALIARTSDPAFSQKIDYTFHEITRQNFNLGPGTKECNGDPFAKADDIIHALNQTPENILEDLNAHSKFVIRDEGASSGVLSATLYQYFARTLGHALRLYEATDVTTELRFLTDPDGQTAVCTNQLGRPHGKVVQILSKKGRVAGNSTLAHWQARVDEGRFGNLSIEQISLAVPSLADSVKIDSRFRYKQADLFQRRPDSEPAHLTLCSHVLHPQHFDLDRCVAGIRSMGGRMTEGGLLLVYSRAHRIYFNAVLERELDDSSIHWSTYIRRGSTLSEVSTSEEHHGMRRGFFGDLRSPAEIAL